MCAVQEFVLRCSLLEVGWPTNLLSSLPLSPASLRVVQFQSWRFYDGIQTEEIRSDKLRWRVREMQTAYDTMRALANGERVGGEEVVMVHSPQPYVHIFVLRLWGWAGMLVSVAMRCAHFSCCAHVGFGLRGKLDLSCGVSAARFLFHQVDWSCVGAVGHSFGGATVTELAAQDPRFHVAMALDPWW